MCLNQAILERIHGYFWRTNFTAQELGAPCKSLFFCEERRTS